MFKKIALVGIFALVSVVSFNSVASTAVPAKKAPVIGAPVAQGMCSAVICH
jgi:hypothetical protein